MLNCTLFKLRNPDLVAIIFSHEDIDLSFFLCQQAIDLHYFILQLVDTYPDISFVSVELIDNCAALLVEILESGVGVLADSANELLEVVELVACLDALLGFAGISCF